MIKMSPAAFLSSLKTYFSAPLAKTFQQFKLGAMTFFLGMVIVYMAVNAIEPSLRQEVFVLIGLLIGGLGFLIAMFAQVRMLMSRLLNFWFDEK